jgi:hypothetical protein
MPAQTSKKGRMGSFFMEISIDRFDFNQFGNIIADSSQPQLFANWSFPK